MNDRIFYYFSLLELMTKWWPIFLTIRLPSSWQTKLHYITAHHGMEVGCQLQQFPLIMKDEIVPVMYMEPMLTCNLAISANNRCSWLWQPIVCSFLIILICCQVFPNGLWFILVHHEILCLATRIGKFFGMNIRHSLEYGLSLFTFWFDSQIIWCCGIKY